MTKHDEHVNMIMVRAVRAFWIFIFEHVHARG
jgi:hypothetical protein